MKPWLYSFRPKWAAAWATLCAEFPREVTASRRHDWYRTTGRSGPWVIPDWSQAGQHHDGGRSRHHPVPGGGALPSMSTIGPSVIGGWAPMPHGGSTTPNGPSWKPSGGAPPVTAASRSGY